jgi:hypothetical protein
MPFLANIRAAAAKATGFAGIQIADPGGLARYLPCQG